MDKNEYSILRDILDFLKKRVKGQDFYLSMEKNVFFEILGRKKKNLTDFKEGIKLKWEEFSIKNQKRIIKKTYTTFLYNNFQDFFKSYLDNFFGFKSENLEKVSVDFISDTNLFLEYNYFLSSEEESYIKEISKRLDSNTIGLFPAQYLFFIIAILGTIIRKIIQEPIHIILDAAIMKYDGKRNYLNFLIIIKDSKDEIFNYYLDMALYYFFKQFKGIPEKYYEKLLRGRKKLFQIALTEYSNAKEKLIELLYYFYKKCKLLQNFSPLLDFFNFVCARVEDSNFSKLDIVKKEFLDNFDYSEEKKNSLIKLFDFLDKKSTLYSTFQANNLPSPKAQFNLFLLYMKYYFGSGLEALEVGKLLYLPEIFRITLNRKNKEENTRINANSIKNIEKFIKFFSIVSNIENSEIVFKKIFNKSVSQINYELFRTFLISLNTKFFMVINEENKKLSKNPQNNVFTFNIIADHICRMLYVLIDKIFLRDTPDGASHNFIDPRSRYTGKNIALRVLELFMFQDINFSDDIWPDYIITLNKNKIKKEILKFGVKISDKFFYSTDDLVKINTIYNFQSFTDLIFFEEWLIQEIIIPLNNFILTIKNSVKNIKNSVEVYEKLSELMLVNIKDKKKIQEIKYICQELAPFWKISE